MRSFSNPAFSRFFSSSVNPLRRINLYHLRQDHNLGYLKTLDDSPLVQEAVSQAKSEVVQSQFELAKFIRQLKSPLIVSEGQIRDLAQPKELKDCSPQTKHLLAPFLLPDTFNRLNAKQQKILHDKGAAKYLFYTMELQRVYKSCRPQVNEHIVAALDPLMKASLNSISEGSSAYMSPALKQVCDKDREAEALFCTKEAALAQNKVEVDAFVIYGALHDFEGAVADFNDPLFKYAGSYNFSETPKEAIERELLSEFMYELENSPIHEELWTGDHGLDPSKPWAVKALKYYNFESAWRKGQVTMAQLNELTATQVYQLKGSFKGEELKAKVLECVAENQAKDQMKLSRLK